MKKLTTYLFALALVFTSCSKNEAVQENTATLLKSYKIVKDTEGNYAINYTVNNNVSTEIVSNTENGSKDFYFLSNRSNSVESSAQEKLSLVNNSIKVDFIEDNAKRKSITIADVDNVSAKGEEAGYLVNYSIEEFEDDNNEDSYTLNFTVNNGVKVDFSYNEVLGVNEVHLRKGKSTETTYSKTYSKTEGELKIDFVNHYVASAKSAQASSGNNTYQVRRPRPIIRDLN